MNADLNIHKGHQRQNFTILKLFVGILVLEFLFTMAVMPVATASVQQPLKPKTTFVRGLWQKYQPVYEIDRSKLLQKYPCSELGTVNDDPSNFSVYYTYEEMERDLISLEMAHRDIAKLYKLTRTYDGHYVYAMKISDDVYKEEEEEEDVLIMGAHHGREWPSFEAPMFFIFYMLENYGKCPRVSYLIDNREIWVIPMLNPDGVVYDMAQGGGVWRKNREPNYLSETVGVGPLPDPKIVPISYGTDLNRNYAYRWGYFGGTNPHLSFSQNYPGPPDNKDDDGDMLKNEDPVDLVDNDRDGLVDEDPAGGFSTAETRAVRDLVEGHNFVVSLSFHTYSELILWPWGWTSEPTPDATIFERLGHEMAKLTNYTPMQAYELYPTDGDSDDWLYAIHGVYAFTIEMCKQFIPPKEEIRNFVTLNLGPQLFITEVASNPRMDDVIIVHEPLKNSSTPTSYYKISAMVLDPYGIINTSINVPVGFRDYALYLHYRINNGQFKTVKMDESISENGTRVFHGVIPGTSDATKITYYFEFQDPRGYNITLPKYVPYKYFVFYINTELNFTQDIIVAILMAALILSVVWGGFGYSIVIARRFERSKTWLED